MKYYTSIQTVNVTKEIANKALDFSRRVTPTTIYDDTNQYSKDKIMNDHFISKTGEEAAKIVLSRYATVVGPDYQIYYEKAKSWADDLYVNRIGVAIKTQKRSTAQRFGLSWTFQSAPGRKDIILNKPEAWVILVVYEDASPYACLVYPPYQMKELTLGEPKLLKLQGLKKVVYADTLPL